MKNMNFSRAGELHRRACRQAALQDGPVGCTLRRAGGLYIKLGCGKGWAGGLPCFSARPALFRSPLDRFFVQPTGPPICLLCSLPSPPISVIHGLDIGGRHGRRFVLLRHTHSPQRRPYPICTSRNRNVRHQCGGG